jgi:arylsulfatase
MFGNRGIYHEGWTAVAKHKTPWATAERDTPPMSEDRWELYDTRSDWTQAVDLAQAHPERLAELQELFLAEARRNHVLPMDDQLSGRFDARSAGRPAPPRTLRLAPGAGRLREDAVPSLKNTSFAIRATLTSDGSAEGVIVAQGGGFGGWSLYVKDGLLTYAYNYGAVTVTHVRSAGPLAAGEHVVEVLFTYDGGGLGRGGDVRLVVDGEKVGEGRVERTLPFFFSMDQTLDVGLDRGTPVTGDYGREARGFAFTGTIREVVIAAGDDALTPTDDQLLKATLVTH